MASSWSIFPRRRLFASEISAQAMGMFRLDTLSDFWHSAYANNGL
jgi:hypothetical protein